MDEFNSLFGRPVSEGDSLVFRIQQKAWTGCLPPSLRGISWRVLLGLLPNSTSVELWAKEFQSQFISYKKLKEENLPRIDKVSIDPLTALSGETQSEEWTNYYKDIELSNFIQGDLNRLYMNGIDDEYFQTSHRREILLSILFLWSVRNRDISYRQGMHEIVGPILFSLENELQHWGEMVNRGEIEPSHPLKQVLLDECVEAYTFWIFDRIMLELKILYDPTPTAHGKESQPHVVRFCTTVQEHFLRDLDPDLCAHLEDSYVQAQLYGMRWCRLLFGREFHMTDSMCFKLWDYIFACCLQSDHSNDYLERQPTSSPTKEPFELEPFSTAEKSSSVPSQTPTRPVSISPLSLPDKSERTPGNVRSVLSPSKVVLDDFASTPEVLALKARRSAYSPLITAVGDFMLAMLLRVNCHNY